MTFSPGDRVHVAGLGTGIVREERNGGRYTVEIKGRTMVVAGTDLKSATVDRASRGRADQPPTAPPSVERHDGASPAIDLHGRTAAEAIDALDGFLNDAILDGRPEVRVIHGRSGGTLRAAVHRRLAQLPSIRAFRLDPRNPGVTIITL